jgi:hypothetical protein
LVAFEKRMSKLMPRADVMFIVLKKINVNAYKLNLTVDFRVSPIFNIAYLKPYLREKDELESRMTQIQDEEKKMMTTQMQENSWSLISIWIRPQVHIT